MGMGYSANRSTMITEDELVKLVPNELKAFNDYLTEKGIEKSPRFGQALGSGDVTSYLYEGLAVISDEESEEQGTMIVNLYDKLREAFQKETGIGLFGAGHNSEDEGSRYDEVDGFFWEVIVYTLSADALKLKERGIVFDDVHYVQYG